MAALARIGGRRVVVGASAFFLAFVALGLAAVFAAPGGIYWGVTWHSEIGRESFWIPRTSPRSRRYSLGFCSRRSGPGGPPGRAPPRVRPTRPRRVAWARATHRSPARLRLRPTGLAPTSRERRSMVLVRRHP